MIYVLTLFTEWFSLSHILFISREFTLSIIYFLCHFSLFLFICYKTQMDFWHLVLSYIWRFYNVFKRLEKEIINMEHTMQPDRYPTTRTTLNKTKIEYVSLLKLQENILREKAKVWCLVNGVINSTYFHKVIQDIWRRIRINKILEKYQPWVQGNANVSEVGVK